MRVTVNFSRRQLPVSDASVLHRFWRLDPQFFRLFPRRQKPVVRFVGATAQMAASETGSLVLFESAVICG
jgi:hypothetical protein